MASQLSLSLAQLGAGLSQIPGTALVGAGALFAASVLVETLSWYRIMRAVAVQSRALPLLDAFAVFNVTAIGKYLPGKVWGYAWQVYLLARRGLPPSVSLRAGAIALVVASAAGAAVGCAGAFLGNLGAAPTAASLVAVAVLTALILFPQRSAIVSALARRLRIDADAGPVAPDALAEAGGGYCAVWMVYGAGGVLLARALEPSLTFTTAAAVVAAMCLSWLVGMVVVIAPAGLGVREAVMALALSHLPGRLGFILPVATRLLLVVVDLALEASALAILWYRRLESAAPDRS